MPSELREALTAAGSTALTPKLIDTLEALPDRS